MSAVERLELRFGCEVVPYLLMLIPWAMAVREIFRGMRHGELTEYLRKSSESDDRAWRICRRDAEPWAFRILFAFYAIVAVVVPVLLVYVYWSKRGAT